MILEGAKDFQPGQHTVDTIKLSAGGLAIEVAPGHDRIEHVVPACSSQKQIADSIEFMGAADFFSPSNQ